MNELGLFKAVASTLPTTEYVYEKLNAYNLSHVFLINLTKASTHQEQK